MRVMEKAAVTTMVVQQQAPAAATKKVVTGSSSSSGVADGSSSSQRDVEQQRRRRRVARSSSSSGRRVPVAAAGVVLLSWSMRRRGSCLWRSSSGTRLFVVYAVLLCGARRVCVFSTLQRGCASAVGSAAARLIHPAFIAAVGLLLCEQETLCRTCRYHRVGNLCGWKHTQDPPLLLAVRSLASANHLLSRQHQAHTQHAPLNSEGVHKRLDKRPQLQPADREPHLAGRH